MTMQHSSDSHDSLPLIVRDAVGGVLSDATLSDKVATAVLKALEEHEDALFFKIIEETEDNERVDIEKIRDALKP